MGQNDSSCCGAHEGPPQPDPYNTTGGAGTKRTSSKDALLNGDTDSTNGEKTKFSEEAVDNTKFNAEVVDNKQEYKKAEAECILSGDITKCESLSRSINIVIKYNEWLENNDLLNKRKLKLLNEDTMDYNKYSKDINELFLNERETFISDANHIKHFHHYNFNEISEYIKNNTSRKKHNECINDNCFSMKYHYLGNKDLIENNSNNILIRLTNLHIFLYHSMYISELNIENVHPRDTYLIINYIERKKRILNFKVYENEYDNNNGNVFIKIVHLISFYYGGKFIEDDDTLDGVSPLGLAQFIENTMNKATLNQVWSKLDRDGSDTIDIDEVDDILLLTVILSIATKHKESGDSKAPNIDKTELKHLMEPIGNWMKNDKFLKQPVITKEEFRDTFSKWLKEYHQTNGGIIADEEMEQEMLIKYKINNNDEKNGNIMDKIPFNIFKSGKNKYNSDRLVINCEYLLEHYSDKKGYDFDQEEQQINKENN